GLFRLGAMESTAAVRLPALLASYHRRYPDVNLELHTGNPNQLATSILSGELDAAFVAEPVAEEPFEKAPAFIEQLVMVAPTGHPPISRNAEVPRTMVAFEIGCPHRKRLEDWYAARGEMPERTIELSSYHAMLGCVAAGMGVALLPRSVLATFPESRQLSVHALPPGADRAATILIWRKGAGSPNIEALKQILPQTRESHRARKFARSGNVRR